MLIPTIAILGFSTPPPPHVAERQLNNTPDKLYTFLAVAVAPICSAPFVPRRYTVLGLPGAGGESPCGTGGRRDRSARPARTALVERPKHRWSGRLVWESFDATREGEGVDSSVLGLQVP